MSNLSTLDPQMEQHIHRDSLHSTLPRESTLTPMEYPFTASQAHIQWLSSQKPGEKIVKDLVHEETTIPTNLEKEQPSPPLRTTYEPP